MNGFLFDENLPAKIKFTPTLPIQHVSLLGKSPDDVNIWDYAKENNLVIVTKDADFSERIIISSPPPKVIHLKIGNVRRKKFHAFLAKVWPQIEKLIDHHRLINVYLDRFEMIE